LEFESPWACQPGTVRAIAPEDGVVPDEPLLVLPVVPAAPVDPVFVRALPDADPDPSRPTISTSCPT